MIPFGATVQMFDVIKTISNPLCVSVAYELLFILMSSDQSRNCVQCVGGAGEGGPALQTAGEDKEGKVCQQGLLLKRLAARNQRQEK